MRALFAAHPAVGHTQALRTIGVELRARGHAVDFAMTRVPTLPRVLPTPEPLRAAQQLAGNLVADGFEHLSLPMSLRGMWAADRVAKNRGYDELEWAVELFSCDARAVARRLAQEIERRGVGVVVADFTFFGAWLAADLTRVPFVAVFHSGLPFPVEGHPPLGSGLTDESPRSEWRRAEQRLEAIGAKLDARLRGARAALGLWPTGPRMISRPYASSLNVLTTFEAFELPRPGLAASAAGPLLWAGPCLGARAGESGDFPWDRLEGKEPLVYISLGTVFNDQPEIYRVLLQGTRRAGARAVVAAGASLERVRAIASERDVVVRFAPQVALLPRMSAVIGHGGNNSTNETLRAGKPLLVVPFGAEQIANAQRVARLGVGRMLQPDALAPECVARALEEALGEAMQGRARSLAASVPPGDGAAVAADAIERLALR